MGLIRSVMTRLPAPVRSWVEAVAPRVRRYHLWSAAGRDTRRAGRAILSGPVTVGAGPFAGMAYVARAPDLSLLPRVVGSYEAELHDVVEQIVSAQPGRIVNIGAGEGYYAVGFARRLPSVRVVAFEIHAAARRSLRAVAASNGISSRVDVRGACDVESLERVLEPGAVVVCDCEGAEAVLMDPERVPALLACDVLVELHDFVDPSISSTLAARFAGTHDATGIRVVGRDPADWRLPAGLDARARAGALDEHRPAGMAWTWFVRRV